MVGMNYLLCPPGCNLRRISCRLIISSNPLWLLWITCLRVRLVSMLRWMLRGLFGPSRSCWMKRLRVGCWCRRCALLWMMLCPKITAAWILSASTHHFQAIAVGILLTLTCQLSASIFSLNVIKKTLIFELNQNNSSFIIWFDLNSLVWLFIFINKLLKKMIIRNKE